MQLKSPSIEFYWPMATPTHCVRGSHGGFGGSAVELSSCNGDCAAHGAENADSLAFVGKEHGPGAAVLAAGA